MVGTLSMLITNGIVHASEVRFDGQTMLSVEFSVILLSFTKVRQFKRSDSTDNEQNF